MGKRHETRHLSLYRSGSLKIVAREIARNRLDLVGVQKVGWGEQKVIPFVYGNGNENHKLRTGFLYNTEYYQQLRE
jgi:hypothetical protein